AVICITPSHVSGKVDVVLFSPDGNAVLKDGFLYFAEKSVIPNVPSTGLFRLGDKVVMSSDVLILSIIFLIIGVTLVFIVGDAKKKTRATAGFSVKSGKRAVAAKRKTTTSRKAPVSAKRKAAPKKRK
ncbi:MAG: hypothetical protein LBL08_01815, partial [Candidatus Nomurabacteria bacterium]|nr:hypothetical protein [Candidatus Nomurabacteria bacterium]